VLKALAALLLVQLALILGLNWVALPTTAFMLQNDAESVVQETVGIEHVSRNFLAAVMIHEDDRLPYRFLAFDVHEFWDRTATYLRGEPDESGSTIPQQLAKNLFLTPEQDGFRKGLEAGLAMELSVLVSDARILELYVNFAQFGPDLYGVCAASWYYFGTPPDTIELSQAAQLVGLLPSPLHVQRGPDGGLDFDVPDGSGFLSAQHVWRAEEQVPYWFEQTGGWQPVWDLGIDGFAQDQPEAEDDCSEMPAEVAELIAAEQ
jgi:monofunctional glycosyltransferase